VSGRTSLDGFLAGAYIIGMAHLNLSLPAELESYVDARVAAEGFANPADFVRDLVQRDQEEYQAEIRRVRALVQEGMDSGIVEAEPEDVLDEIIADLREKHG
jgi:Arc/MetJ-type ribon-helix-helix transcriptional regulator